MLRNFDSKLKFSQLSVSEFLILRYSGSDISLWNTLYVISSQRVACPDKHLLEDLQLAALQMRPRLSTHLIRLLAEIIPGVREILR
jgi:hypothetical protein